MSSISVKEFKMWLEGVEDMQAEGWIPDAKQWAKIREKIDQLNEGQVRQTNEDSHTRVAVPMYAPPAAPVELPAFSIPQFNPMASVPIQAAPSGLGVKAAPGVGGGIQTTTPNIDTSNGSYKSLFEG